MKAPFIWDGYSDQPYPIKDRVYKQQMRTKHRWSYLPLLLLTMIFFPLGMLMMRWVKGEAIEGEAFYGMGVDIDKGEAQVGLIEELGVKHLLIRMPLWQMDRIDAVVAFAQSFGADKQILLSIIQDREHIEDSDLLQRDVAEIFKKFSPFVTEYQIGHAINRTKWGFFSMEEYLGWYEQIATLRDRDYPKLKLVGSSVIDFEYHYTIRTLFNGFNLRYDRFCALLYVDRRGAPTNKQMGIFDTRTKIDMLYALMRLSPKTTQHLYITEVNWPLSNTAPYAPTSERECVSPLDYARYMGTYHTIARESGKVERIYWHQLIATGYGLVDDREGRLTKYPAFERYKQMVAKG